MSRFDFVVTSLEGLTLLRRRPIGDSRGFLERLFCADDLKQLLGERTIVQVNRTFTAKGGTLRGLHFQFPPHAEMKFVSCLSGEIFDVAVDLRRGSPTFLRWHAEVLSADNHHTLAIPEGFAHGFQTLTDSCELVYMHTARYEPSAEGGVRWNDPRIGVNWPLAVAEQSSRDASFSLLAQEFAGIDI